MIKTNIDYSTVYDKSKRRFVWVSGFGAACRPTIQVDI